MISKNPSKLSFALKFAWFELLIVSGVDGVATNRVQESTGEEGEPYGWGVGCAGAARATASEGSA